MELKLKDNKLNNPESHEWSDMADYKDDTSMEEINMFRQPIEIEPEKFDRRKPTRRGKKKGIGYAIICISVPGNCYSSIYYGHCFIVNEKRKRKYYKKLLCGQRYD